MDTGYDGNKGKPYLKQRIKVTPIQKNSKQCIKKLPQS